MILSKSEYDITIFVLLQPINDNSDHNTMPLVVGK